MIRAAALCVLLVGCCALRSSGVTEPPVESGPSTAVAPTIEVGTAIVGGTASWTDGETAAGPLLRELIGPGWRGSWITVRYREATVRVQLTDWCQCYRGEPRERLADLSRESFVMLADPDKRLLQVQVELP